MLYRWLCACIWSYQCMNGCVNVILLPSSNFHSIRVAWIPCSQMIILVWDAFQIILLNFDSVNVNVGEKEERMMMTGMHTVVDIFCVGCGSIVGWKYVRYCISFLMQLLVPLFDFLMYPFVIFRRLLMKRAKSTRKGNSLLRGTEILCKFGCFIISFLEHSFESLFGWQNYTAFQRNFGKRVHFKQNTERWFWILENLFH